MNIVKRPRSLKTGCGCTSALLLPTCVTNTSKCGGAVPFFRATFYRWVQVWPDQCQNSKRHRSSRSAIFMWRISVRGENTDGRLIWESMTSMSCCSPTHRPGQAGNKRNAGGAIGHLPPSPRTLPPRFSRYLRGIEEGGIPFVLGERHEWLRAIAK